jgi:serine protease
LISVKVLNRSGSGSGAGVLAGIDYVVSQSQLPGAKRAVINMSLGISQTWSPLDDAVNSAVADHGVVVAVAAGNSNTDACNSSPAGAVSAITVGATDDTDRRASFSNYGDCVDIFAPGVDIRSCSNGGGNFLASGTSMASPHVAGVAGVAGVAALLLEEDPTLTPAELAHRMMIDDALVDVVSHEGRFSPNLFLYTGNILDTSPRPGPGPEPGPACTVKNGSCTNNSECCSLWCRGGGNSFKCG